MVRAVETRIVGKIRYCSKHLRARVAVLAPYSAIQTASAGRLFWVAVGATSLQHRCLESQELFMKIMHFKREWEEKNTMFLEFKGPCPAGEVLIPVNRTNAKCGPDACRNSGPTNALLISKLASYEGSKANKDVVFTFTYKNKCYMTETEAFCGPGKVVRFLHPYKSPFCVPADYEHCPIPFFPKSASYAVPLACPSGQKEDPARNVCVEEIDDILP